jgi:hypothetical protein
LTDLFYEDYNFSNNVIIKNDPVQNYDEVYNEIKKLGQKIMKRILINKLNR